MFDLIPLLIALLALVAFLFFPLWISYAARVLAWLIQHGITFDWMFRALDWCWDKIERWWDWQERVKKNLYGRFRI